MAEAESWGLREHPILSTQLCLGPSGCEARSEALCVTETKQPGSGCAKPPSPTRVQGYVRQDALALELGTAPAVMLITVLPWSVLLLPLDCEFLEAENSISVPFLSPGWRTVPRTLLSTKKISMNE